MASDVRKCADEMDVSNEAEEDCIGSMSMDLASEASLLAVGDFVVVDETVLQNDVLDRTMDAVLDL